jgi:hypothetical protein
LIPKKRRNDQKMDKSHELEVAGDLAMYIIGKISGLTQLALAEES